MTTSSRADRTRRLCVDAIFVAGAMILSYLEFLLPLGAIVPLPGFRLGLANILVLLSFCLCSPIDAAVISATRILLSALLFGSVTSLWFSAMGGCFSFLALLFAAHFLKKCSFVGASVLSAAAHNCGQIAAAMILFGADLATTYLPLLLLASIVYGGITGALLNLLIVRVRGRIL